jgi:hypothetical protein
MPSTGGEDAAGRLLAPAVPGQAAGLEALAQALLAPGMAGAEVGGLWGRVGT